MNALLVKILVAAGGLLFIGALILIIYNQQQLKTQQLAIQTQIVQQQQLVDGIVRSQSQWATKDDISKFADANGVNLKAIQDNLKTLNAQVSSINVISTSSLPQNATNVPSTGTGASNPNPTQPGVCKDGTKCPDQDPFGYQKKEQDLAINENFPNLQVPFGTVGFSAWQQNPWTVKVAQRDYNVSTIVGTDENERQYFYNKFSVSVDGKNYDIPIKSATTKQQYPSATWSWWNPRLLMGVDGGLNINRVTGELVPHVDLGIMSYGQYKTTPDFSILEVGVGYGAINKTGELVITPVAYNIGKKLFSPFMNNTYIGASFQVATDGTFGVGAGLRVGF